MSSEIEKVVAFLLGEGELDGRHFGDEDVPLGACGYKNRYWWRKHLREAFTPPSSATPGDTPEERFEYFVQAGIARSPEPLRELGEYLARVLDEDEFPKADRLLLQLATAAAPQPQERAGSDAGAFWRDAYERMAYQLYRKRGHDDMDAREKAQADIESREREYLATRPQPASDASLPELLIALGSAGVAISGGTHGDPWSVRLPSQPASDASGENEATP